MKNILAEIIENKHLEVNLNKRNTPTYELLKGITSSKRELLSLKKAIRKNKYGIISEFKRNSPSLGCINKSADIYNITQGYLKNGAAALSVLTDKKFFGGDINDIKNIRNNIDIPILRKDFIIDEYQLFEAYEAGADAVLLIASALQKEECQYLSIIAQSLGLETLLEIHNTKEIEYYNEYIDVVGINNRNLTTFKTDINISLEIANNLPKDITLISESGISSPETIKELQKAGFKGFLIGEHFMKNEKPENSLNLLIKKLEEL